jgi:hypothetical protein
MFVRLERCPKHQAKQPFDPSHTQWITYNHFDIAYAMYHICQLHNNIDFKSVWKFIQWMLNRRSFINLKNDRICITNQMKEEMTANPSGIQNDHMKVLVKVCGSDVGTVWYSTRVKIRTPISHVDDYELFANKTHWSPFQ